MGSLEEPIMADFKATVKRNISPVTITVELTFSKVNENGTLSGVTGRITKQPLKGNDIQLSFPPMSGGATYAKVGSLDGIKTLDDSTAGVKTAKTKLF
jgi:hypothetical protein